MFGEKKKQKIVQDSELAFFACVPSSELLPVYSSSWSDSQFLCWYLPYLPYLTQSS
jgi:hypothetical protein